MHGIPHENATLQWNVQPAGIFLYVVIIYMSVTVLQAVGSRFSTISTATLLLWKYFCAHQLKSHN